MVSSVRVVWGMSNAEPPAQVVAKRATARAVGSILKLTDGFFQGSVPFDRRERPRLPVHNDWHVPDQICKCRILRLDKLAAVIHKDPPVRSFDRPVVAYINSVSLKRAPLVQM